MTALFGVRAIAEAADLDPREVIGVVRAGYGDRLAGIGVNSRSIHRKPSPWEKSRWDELLRSVEEAKEAKKAKDDDGWDEFRRSIEEIG